MQVKMSKPNMYVLISLGVIGVAIWVGWLLLWAKFGLIGWTSEPWDCWASKESSLPSSRPINNSYTNMAEIFRTLCLFGVILFGLIPFARCLYDIGPLSRIISVALAIFSFGWLILLFLCTFSF